MSKKLPFADVCDSLNALKDYRLENPGSNRKRVIAVNLANNETLFNDVVTVIAGNSGSLEIMWEGDDGDGDKFDYRSLGLYGRYSTSYNVMEYDAGILKVHSDDIVISIIQ